MRKHYHTLGLQWSLPVTVFIKVATGFVYFFSPETSALFLSGSADLGGMIILENFNSVSTCPQFLSKNVHLTFYTCKTLYFSGNC